MRIIDAFLYNGEPVAEIRLTYLQNHIDHFYIFESSVSQSGLHKPLYGLTLLEKFPHLKHKITYILINNHKHIPSCDDDPIFHQAIKYYAMRIADFSYYDAYQQSCYAREGLFREFMQTYLENILEDDILYFADVDEIPTTELLEFIRENYSSLQFPLHILGDLYQGGLYADGADRMTFWWEGFFCKRKTLQRQILSDVRFSLHINKFNYTDIFPHNKHLLFKYNGRLLINDQYSIVNRYRQRTVNSQYYEPLMFHLRSFLSATAHYRKYMHTSFYPQRGISSIIEQFHFFRAGFPYFRDKVAHIFNVNMFDKKHFYPSIEKNLPRIIYNFCLNLAEKQSVMPSDDILAQEYQKLYAPFQKNYYMMMQKILDDINVMQ